MPKSDDATEGLPEAFDSLDQMRSTIAGMSSDVFLSLSGSGVESALPVIPDLSNTPAARTAQNTRRAAEQAEQTVLHLRELTEAMMRSVQLSEETRKDAEAAQASAKSSSLHAKITGYGSLFAAIGALTISIVTLIVSS